MTLFGLKDLSDLPRYMKRFLKFQEKYLDFQFACPDLVLKSPEKILKRNKIHLGNNLHPPLNSQVEAALGTTLDDILNEDGGLDWDHIDELFNLESAVVDDHVNKLIEQWDDYNANGQGEQEQGIPE